jgi:5'-deoxynucleotidase YfbR-like HD superfamily hydrolase
VTREQVYTATALAGGVKRYSTWPTITQQTVSQHCWRVACLYVEIFGMPRAEVLYYCLHHDSGELWAGDIPFMVKDKTPGLREASQKAEQEGFQRLGITLPELTDEEKAQVKIIDILEMHEFGCHELKLGNTYAQPIINDTREAALDLADTWGKKDLVEIWCNRHKGEPPCPRSAKGWRLWPQKCMEYIT